MAAANAPIAMREALTVTTHPPFLPRRSLGFTDNGWPLQLTSLGIAPQFVTFTHVTMESEKYICVRETSPQNSVVIIDMAMPMQPLRRPITADSALMNPNTRILALKGRSHLANYGISFPSYACLLADGALLAPSWDLLEFGSDPGLYLPSVVYEFALLVQLGC